MNAITLYAISQHDWTHVGPLGRLTPETAVAMMAADFEYGHGADWPNTLEVTARVQCDLPALRDHAVRWVQGRFRSIDFSIEPLGYHPKLPNAMVLVTISR